MKCGQCPGFYNGCPYFSSYNQEVCFSPVKGEEYEKINYANNFEENLNFD